MTASSDYLTASLLAIGYNLAACWLLLAWVGAVVWCRGGRALALVASGLFLVLSLSTVEAAIPLLPCLLVGLLVARLGSARRLLGLTALWTALALPYVVALVAFLRDRTGYARVAAMNLPLDERVRHAVGMWVLNFAPWRWVFNRHPWYLRPPAVVPGAWIAVGAILAVPIALIGMRSAAADDAGADSIEPAPRRALLLTLTLGFAALCANATFADIQFSDLNYRTHLFSRLFASLALALGAYAARVRWRSRWPLVLPIACIAFGVAGGLERQDLFLSTWRLHRDELDSILAAGAPRPGTVMIFRTDEARGRFLATGADYLTASWLGLLYPENAVRFHRTAAGPCTPGDGGIQCGSESFRYDEIVVLDFDPRTSRFVLKTSLTDDPLAGPGAADSYRPAERLRPAEKTLAQRRLLLE
jgi:hypothetical protein